MKAGRSLFAMPAIIALMIGAGNSLAQSDNSRLQQKALEASEHERRLLSRIEQLEKRLSVLEAQLPKGSFEGSEPSVNPDTPATQEQRKLEPGREPERDEIAAEDRGLLDFFRQTTINLTLDGYYAYNFNRPAGRINLLRAYDVMSNSFSLNQATVMIEQRPNPSAGRRFGVRLDLQYGQATETLQGSPNNELRPQVYRPVLQAFGTYIVPIGHGVGVNFGKFASALGIENNYTKDQMNYSRSYLFNFLPFYHFGFHTDYQINSKLSVTHWLVNGVQQSEDFNGFKSQAVLLNIHPTPRISWNVNYYTGIEGRDGVPALNPGLPDLPAQPGLSENLVRPVPRGRLHIFDTYATWNVSDRLTLAAELDYVINRLQARFPPSHVIASAVYARYQLSSKWALAGRAEYFSDRGGLFSGVTQALKETTLTADYKVTEGFLVRTEYRRDFSDRPFFLTNLPQVLKKEQNTATLGMVWWFGRKEGSW